MVSKLSSDDFWKSAKSRRCKLHCPFAECRGPRRVTFQTRKIFEFSLNLMSSVTNNIYNWKGLFKAATSFVRDHYITTEPTYDKLHRGSFNWPQFMLQCMLQGFRALYNEVSHKLILLNTLNSMNPGVKGGRTQKSQWLHDIDFKWVMCALNFSDLNPSVLEMFLCVHRFFSWMLWNRILSFI